MLIVIAVCGFVFGLLGLLAGVLALRTLGQVRRSVGLLGRGGGDRESFLEATARHVELTDQTRRELAELEKRLQTGLDLMMGEIRNGVSAARLELSADSTLLAEIRSERASLAADNSAARDQIRRALERVEKSLGTSVRRVALVRFDGFDDLSGRLSFCLALLDGRGDGIALTSLAGRSDTRLYAKPITDGKATTDLSPEERQAVAAALSA